MKILHAIASLDPDWGGPPVVAAALASAQVGRGDDVSVLSVVSPERRDLTLANYQDFPCFGQVDCHWHETPLGMASILARKPHASVVQRVAGADFVHLHGVWEPILWHTAAAARQLGIPYTMTPHGMLDPWSLSQKRWKKRLALALGYRKMLQGVAFLHMLNDDEHRLIDPLHLTAPRKTVPNGIFLEALDQQQQRAAEGSIEIERLMSLVGGKPYVVFIGRLHYKKGLDYLAEAFAIAAQDHPDLQLMVVGPDGGAQADFEQRIQGHQLSERVHVTGPLFGETKIAALTNAACFCLPSRQEGFSIAILEGLASRTPVIISHECHFPEVAASNAGFVTELSNQAVANAMDSVMREPENARLRGEKGRKLVEDRYTWASVAEQFDALYRESI